MFHCLIFNNLKIQLDFICLGLAPHDINIIMWFWLEVVREDSTYQKGGGLYVISHSSGGGNN